MSCNNITPAVTQTLKSVVSVGSRMYVVGSRDRITYVRIWDW